MRDRRRYGKPNLQAVFIEVPRHTTWRPAGDTGGGSGIVNADAAYDPAPRGCPTAGSRDRTRPRRLPHRHNASPLST